LAGTRDIGQDDVHKKSIITNIERHFDSVSAVLILADGIVPRVTTEMEYTFAALASIFPKNLVNNVGIMFTNVRSPSSWRVSQEELPGALKNAPLFVLDNPLALQNRYNDDPDMRGIVKVCEQRALETLVKLFDWLDGLEPQPVTEVVCLYEKYRNIETKTTNTLAQIDQVLAMKGEINKCMVALRKNSTVSVSTVLAPRLESHVRRTQGAGSFSSIDNTANMTTWEQLLTTTHKIEKQVFVEDTNRRCEMVKDEKEKTTALIAINEIVVHNLNQAIDRATNDLVQLVEEHGRSSLSGGFLDQLGSTIRLLEQRYVDMENNWAGQFTLQERKKGLDDVKRKLALLNSAKENAQKDSVKHQEILG